MQKCFTGPEHFRELEKQLLKAKGKKGNNRRGGRSQRGEGGARYRQIIDAVLEYWTLVEPRGRNTHLQNKLFTGHGLFSDYLYRIGAETTVECKECGVELDSLALKECPRFGKKRRALKDAIGRYFSTVNVIGAFVGTESHRRTVKTARRW